MSVTGKPDARKPARPVWGGTDGKGPSYWYLASRLPYYVSVQVEHEQAVPVNAGPVVGVDLGVKALATFSDGAVVSNPRHLKRRLKKLKRLHRVVSRRTKGSKNRRKAAKRLAKLYRKVANQRKNTLHQVTTKLAKTKSVIVLEDLNVSGMLKNQHLAQSIADVGFGEFKRQLAYKAAWYGSRVVLADRWYASSKTCSGCGWVAEEVELSGRVFHCRNPQVPCRLVMDRDLNAAIIYPRVAQRDYSKEALWHEGTSTTIAL